MVRSEDIFGRNYRTELLCSGEGRNLLDLRSGILLYHAESSQKEKVAHDSKRSTFAIPRCLSLAKVDPKGQSLTSRIIQMFGPVRAFWITMESCLATGGRSSIVPPAASCRRHKEMLKSSRRHGGAIGFGSLRWLKRVLVQASSLFSKDY
jgi:hypothetical protein